LPEEVNVEKDIQDVLVNFTPAERHGVITALKLFSLYETHAGDEWWGGRFKEMFDGAEWHRMAATFAMFELAVHGPFYNKINQLLHLDDENFYL
jgi:ribonucleoside-diphosphate reductase beta chain